MKTTVRLKTGRQPGKSKEIMDILIKNYYERHQEFFKQCFVDLGEGPDITVKIFWENGELKFERVDGL